MERAATPSAGGASYLPPVLSWQPLAQQPAMATTTATSLSPERGAPPAAEPGTEDGFSPRDTVWKRYFSPSRQNSSVAAAAAVATMWEPPSGTPAAPPCLATARSLEVLPGQQTPQQLAPGPMAEQRWPSPWGVAQAVPQPPLQQQQHQQVLQQLPPLPPQLPQQRAFADVAQQRPVAAAGVPEAPLTSRSSLWTAWGPPLGMASNLPQVPPEQLGTDTAYDGGMGFLDAGCAGMQESSQLAGLSCSTSTLQRTMGEFGPPEPPVASHIPHGHQSFILRPQHVQEQASEVLQPLEASAMPEDCAAQSFIVQTSPFLQTQSDSFVQASTDLASEILYAVPPISTADENTTAPSQRSNMSEHETGASRATSAHSYQDSTSTTRVGSELDRGFVYSGEGESSSEATTSNVKPLQPRLRGLPGNTSGSAAGIAESKAGVLPPAPQPPPQQHPQPQQQPVAVPTAQATSTSTRAAARQAAEASSTASASAEALQSTEEELATAAAAVNLRDLAELRSFRYPPAAVCQVLEAVALLLGVSDTRWARMRKLLDNSFLGRLSLFDPLEPLPPAKADRLRALLQAPAFHDGALAERCPAVVSLAAWCDVAARAMQQLRRPVARTSLSNAAALGAPPAAPLPAVSTILVARPDLGGLVVEPPDLWEMSEEELSHVWGLRFGREGVGSVAFHGETDCRELLGVLTEIVLLQPGEVVVYPNPSTKPPPGHGLNKAADITLYGCMPKTQGFRDKKARERYKRRVRQMTEDKGAEFVDYDCDHGIWKFRVRHF